MTTAELVEQFFGFNVAASGHIISDYELHRSLIKHMSENLDLSRYVFVKPNSNEKGLFKLIDNGYFQELCKYPETAIALKVPRKYRAQWLHHLGSEQ
jgi:hypothetical protein